MILKWNLIRRRDFFVFFLGSVLGESESLGRSFCLKIKGRHLFRQKFACGQNRFDMAAKFDIINMKFWNLEGACFQKF